MKNKDELKQEVEKIEKSSDTVQEYIQTFNKAFDKVNYSNKDTNILENLYRNFIDQAYKPTAVVQFLVDRIVEVESKLKSKFNEEEKKLFEIYEFLQDKITDYSGLESFISGYSLANALNNEVQNYSNNSTFIKEQIRIKNKE